MTAKHTRADMVSWIALISNRFGDGAAVGNFLAIGRADAKRKIHQWAENWIQPGWVLVRIARGQMRVEFELESKVRKRHNNAQQTP